MPDCDCLPGCPFFNDRMAHMPSIAGMMKNQYCKGNFTQCARHMVKEALGKERVPVDLFPNQTEKADKLLNPPL
jgi:hypothetical protein